MKFSVAARNMLAITYYMRPKSKTCGQTVGVHCYTSALPFGEYRRDGMCILYLSLVDYRGNVLSYKNHPKEESCYNIIQYRQDRLQFAGCALLTEN